MNYDFNKYETELLALPFYDLITLMAELGTCYGYMKGCIDAQTTLNGGLTLNSELYQDVYKTGDLSFLLLEYLFDNGKINEKYSVILHYMIKQFQEINGKIGIAYQLKNEDSRGSLGTNISGIDLVKFAEQILKQNKESK